MVKRIRAKTLAIGTLVVGGAGYLAGILTAPKSGKETREQIVSTATKAKTDGEKQIKKLHSELTDLTNQADSQLKNAKARANKELVDATSKAKSAKEKSRHILSAIHNGDAEDPNLAAVIEELKMAKKNLVKYLKK